VPVIDGIIGDEKSAFDHVGNHGLITVAVNFLLGIEETKSNLLVSG
jgi:hypothetical protein